MRQKLDKDVSKMLLGLGAVLRTKKKAIAKDDNPDDLDLEKLNALPEVQAVVTALKAKGVTKKMLYEGGQLVAAMVLRI